MAELPRKNIAREIRDVRFPTSHVPRKPAMAETPVRNIQPVPMPPRAPIVSRRRFPKRPLAVFLSAALVAGVVGGALWYRQKIAQAVRLREVLVLSENSFQTIGTADLPTSLGGWAELFKGVFLYYGGFGQASLQALAVAEGAEELLRDLPTLFFNKDGPGLIARLVALRDDLSSLRTSLETMNSRDGGLQVLPELGNYSAYAPDVERLEAFLNGFLGLLQAPGEHRFLVFFGNSAELRPGGGFLGSFADLKLGNGQIGELSVHDINEVDRGLAANIVPPKPLQAIVGRWRAADANWFFDYPTSARKTLEIMSRSSFYDSTALDGAILISPQVLQDILEATGPVVLADGTSVAADTVIPLIQREVQAGQASGAAAPKQILAELLPPLQSKLQNLSPEGRTALLESAQVWVRNRDLEVFFKDPELARVAAYYDLDGGLYAVGESFLGDYFAAVNANVGGGKSDAFITDAIELESDLRADGVVTTRAAVTRISRAGPGEEWWYRVPNQNFLHIFTPPGAELVAASGGRARPISPRADYSSGFETDPDIAALESSLEPVSGFPAVSQFRQAGKNVFATWITTQPGESSAAAFEYQRQLKRSLRAGDVYTFVFERQSGAKQSLRLVLNAPPGFIWEESAGPRYEYFLPNTPGRVILSLTLRQM